MTLPVQQQTVRLQVHANVGDSASVIVKVQAVLEYLLAITGPLRALKNSAMKSLHAGISKETIGEGLQKKTH